MRHLKFCLALVALLPAGCGGGGGEDFTVDFKRPVASVFSPFAQISIAEAAPLFPGIKVDRTRPSENELLYTIPGTGEFPATIKLSFETTDTGGTRVHAAVDVPAVRAKIDGVDKVISESKVERELQRILRDARDDLDAGSAGTSLSRQMSGVLLALAVATNDAYLNRALAMKDNPEMLAGVLGAFGDPDMVAEADPERVDRARGDAAQGEDPGELADMERRAAAEAQHRDARDAAEAAAPMDEASGSYAETEREISEE